MDDDEIEVIDLSPELDDPEVRRREPRRRRRPSRRVVIAVTVLGAVVIVGGLVLRPGSDPNVIPPRPPDSVAVVPPTAWVPSDALTNLASYRSLAVFFGDVALLEPGEPPRQIVEDISYPALVGMVQGGEALLLYRSGSRVLVGPRSLEGDRNVLPSPIALLPDADGRWSSTFGPLEARTALREIMFPAGTTPVAKVHADYLLVDHARTALWRWHAGSRLSLVANGRARVLAISGDVVAWTNDASAADSGDGIVRLTNLRTGHVTNVREVFQPVTARFSPDGSRIAILVGKQQQFMLVADTATGRLRGQVLTASGGNGLHVFTSVPAAFQPVPFSWAPTGLTLISQTTRGYFFRTMDPADGSIISSSVPDGLEQLVALAP